MSQVWQCWDCACK